MENKSTITFRLVIDWEKNTVELRRKGDATPISKSFIVSAYTIANTFRDLAFEALQEAHRHEDTVGRAFTSQAALEQARKAIHSNINVSLERAING